ncbi:MAG: phosphoglucosamine mutase [Acidimicrobiales bacterium]
MSLRFGTDGVRGPADELTDVLVSALGRAAATVLGAGVAGSGFVIGRDPRLSGPRIEAALAHGLTLGGATVEVLGVVPTPTIAWVCADRQVPGAVISASHNPFDDNGIKFFAAGGVKLSDAIEADLEAELDRLLAASPPEPTGGAPAGTEQPAAEADIERWCRSLVDSLEGRRLDGLEVVIDCANGSSSIIAPDLLRRLGATVQVLHADPDGLNINERCGSTHPADLQEAVVASGAAVGLAFDGDADRVLAVDEHGELVDGDHLIALCALDLRARGGLTDDAVVVTVMTNLGFRLAMAEHGIEVVETQVGDRYVLEALDKRGLALGGEQSGHVIFRRLATTGDGLLTGVQLLDLLVRAGRPLSELTAAAMTRLPQVLVGVRVAQRDPRLVEALAPDIAAVEAELGERGRVLVRTSGTEPLVRVMVEAPDEAVARAAAARQVDAVNRRAADLLP